MSKRIRGKLLALLMTMAMVISLMPALTLPAHAATTTYTVAAGQNLTLYGWDFFDDSATVHLGVAYDFITTSAIDNSSGYAVGFSLKDASAPPNNDVYFAAGNGDTYVPQMNYTGVSTKEESKLIFNSTTPGTYYFSLIRLNGSGLEIDRASVSVTVTAANTAPTVSSVSVPASKTYKTGDTLDFTVNFSSAVTVTGTPQLPITLDTGGTVYASYVSSGSTSTALKFSYTIVAGNLDATGIAVGSDLSLSGGTIKDTSTSTDATLTLSSVGVTTGVMVDGVTPTISSAVRLSPSDQFTTAGTVTYRVTFGSGVTGLTADNFDLNPSLTGASITNVYVVAGTSNTQWIVVVNTGTADGILALRLINSTGLSSSITTTLPYSGQTYTIDRTPPVVNMSAPSVASTGTGPVSYTVTFPDTNFDSTTLSSSDITVNKTGTAAASSVSVSGTGTTRTVTLSGISGNGTLGISINAGVAADLAGNTNAQSAASTTFAVINKLSATTSLTSSLNPSTYEQSVTFTATVTAGATGTLTFKDGSTTLGTATLDGSSVATFTTSCLAAGSHSITAVYGGDATYTGSTSSALTQIVNSASTTTSLTSSLNPSNYGQSVTFTATVTTGATGTVTFKDGSTVLGTGAPSGDGTAILTTSTLGGGSHSITAVYGGDANFAGSTSSALTQVVNTLPTTTSLGSSLNPASFNQSVTLTATVTSGATGTVTFKDGSTILGTGNLGSGTAIFNTSSFASGSHSLTAVYDGDSNYSSSTSSALTQVVNALSTTTTLSASPNPSTYSQTVVLTATVTSGATGTVTFKDGTITLGSASLSSGTATYAISTLSGGSHSLTAVYNGSQNYNGSTSTPLSFTVAKASFTLPIATGPTPSTYGQPVTVSTTLPNDANGAVIFKDGSTTIATVPVSSGGASLQTTTLPVGSHSFSAIYSGDTNYLGANSGTVTQVVDTASSTMSLSASPSPSTYGQLVTLTATVTSGATGTVTFKDGSTTLGTGTLNSGTATLATSALATGSHSLSAIYGGNTNFAGSTSSTLTQTVTAAPTTTTLSASPNPSTYGQAVTFTATVTSGATGTVTFKDGSTTLGTASLSSGTATFSTAALATGSHSLSAIYGGNTNFAGSTSSTLTQTVTAAPTTTTLSASPNPSTYGQAVMFTATVTSGATGTVTFKDGSTTLGTASLSSGTATFSTAALATGSHSLTAVYGGDANYAVSTSSALTQIVNALATTTSLSSNLNPSTYGQSVTFTVTVTAGATGTVIFMDSSTSLGTATLSGGTATLSTTTLGGGSHSITAMYGGDANYAASTSSALSQTVNVSSTTTSLSSNLNPSNYGLSITFTATVTTGATGAVTFMDGSTILGTGTLSGGTATFTTSTLGGGSHNITAIYGGDANYAASTSSALSQTVNAASTTTLGVSSTPVQVNGQSYSAGTSQATTDLDGKTTTTVTVDTEKLDKILDSQDNNATVTIPIRNGSDKAEGVLTGEMVKTMENKEATLEIKTDTVSYTLPASQINIDSVSSQIGSQVALKDIKVSVKIAKPTADTVKVVEDTANEGNYQLVVKPVEFEITCTSGDKTIEVSKFNGYVERTVAIPDGVDPSKITTGIVLNADGTFRHVPTEIVVINGKYYAKINSLTNSTYSVIYNPVEFADVAAHWAKTAINDMGSRMVVTGVGGNNYEPDRSITRAEFAAIVVRALGLQQGTTESSFGDVALADWFNGFVDTATSYSLISGYNNASFGPNDKITREQAMAILAKAMKITGLSTSLSDSQVNALLAKYTDGASVSNYAKMSTAICIKTGIVTGSSGTTLSPKATVTRAEVAVMVQRLLQKSGLI